MTTCSGLACYHEASPSDMNASSFKQQACSRHSAIARYWLISKQSNSGVDISRQLEVDIPKQYIESMF